MTPNGAAVAIRNLWIVGRLRFDLCQSPHSRYSYWSVSWLDSLCKEVMSQAESSSGWKVR